jgi:hypothetical protein
VNNFWDSEDLVPPRDCEELEKPFSMEEIKVVVFSCYSEGPPSPNGLSFLFYQKYWEVIKRDIYDMFRDFHGVSWIYSD